MKRRRFLGTALAGAAVPFALSSGCRIERVKQPARQADNLAIAGKTLEELREQYRYDLFDDFLPFMDAHVVDRESGGFLTAADRDGSLLSTDKTTVAQGCGIWLYSSLFHLHGRNEGHLDIARKALALLRKNKPVGHYLWPESFTREGRPKGKPDGRGFSDLAAALGFAGYARASGEARWRDAAKETLLKAVRLYDLPDYSPAIGRDYLGPRAALYPGARVLAVWLRIIGTAASIIEDAPDQEVRDVLDRSTAAVLGSHHNPDHGLTNEFLAHDLSRPVNAYSRLVHTGNAIETHRTLLSEAVRTRNRGLFETAAARFRAHVEAAWDTVFGGVYRCLYDVERNVWDLAKELRVQEETLSGALIVIEHTGEQWAKDLFGRTYSYVRERFPLKKHGYPLWMEEGDRRVTFTPHAARVEMFFHPRHIMTSLLVLDRMIARGGKVSDVFE